mmetsp:Transcript_18379/g.45599  ORF Transcript_18379/g.45599 Transcript_18379/m.45599 type:complete len:199 (-) Transcript_18379:246-842(-)
MQPTANHVSNSLFHPWLMLIQAVGFATWMTMTAVCIDSSVSNNSRCESNDNLEPNSIRNNNSNFPFYELLVKQLQVVVYSEARDAASIASDSGRNKPTGLVGLACKHCLAVQQQALPLDPSASTFPQDRRSLAKEVSAKMYDHLQTCQHCPPHTQTKLKELQRATHNNSNNLIKKMSRDERLFFRTLWYEMGHKDMQE